MIMRVIMRAMATFCGHLRGLFDHSSSSFGGCAQQGMHVQASDRDVCHGLLGAKFDQGIEMEICCAWEAVIK